MSFTLNYTGDEINAILARANNGGEIDDELVLKAPLASPALTGTPTAPTQAEGDDSTKIATTEYADRAADAAGAAAEAAAKEYTDEATSALYITDTASGSIASFADGADGIPMRSVKASIEPVQDLHGYANPWPAGGGLNKLPPLSTQTKTGITLTSNNGQYTISGTATAATEFEIPISGLSLGSYTLSVLNATADSTASISMQVIGANSTVLANGYLNSANRRLTIDASSEAVASVKIVIVNGRSLANFELSPVLLSGTDYATEFSPYSNICPIDGWTGAEVTRTGINVWDEEWELGNFDPTGQPVSSNSQIRTKNYTPCVPQTAYYCVAPSSAANLVFYYFDKDKQFVGYAYVNSNSVFTTPSNARYLKFKLATAYGTVYKNNVSINYPSSDHDYHAYLGQTFPVTWESQAGTVYGGTIDVVSGELRVDISGLLFDGSSDEGWTRDSVAERGFYIAVNSMTKLLNYSAAILCDKLQVFTENSAQSFRDAVYGVTGYRDANSSYPSQNWLYAKGGGATTAAEFKTWLASNPIQVTVPLAQPVTYQLTPQQITSLLGQNNVWSNTGDVEVTYVADPTKYIDKRITELFAALSQ